MLKLIKYFLVVALLFFSISYTALAQPAPPPPTQPATPGPPTRSGTTATPCATYFSTHPISNIDPDTTGGLSNFNERFETSPPAGRINETFPCVDVTFHMPDFLEDKDYFLCTGSNNCLNEGRVDSDDVKKGEPSRPDGDSITFTVCGHGSDDLYVNEKCYEGDDTNSGLIDTGHYFLGGNMYVFSLVYKGDNYHSLANGGFYVFRSQPLVQIHPKSDLTTNSTIKVTLGGDLRPPLADGKKTDKRNNYFIEMKGPGYERANCTDTIAGNSKGITFSGLGAPGQYTIAIKEQRGEGNIIASGARATGQAIPLDDLSLLFPPCKGGSTYSEVVCEVTKADDGGGKCSDPQIDPEGEEYRAFLDDLASLNGAEGKSFFPCGDGTSFEKPGDCLSLNTAIGPIRTRSQGFITDIFSLVLAIAGFGAIILIIYSGYLFMMSSGDKEKLAGARETITSAIVGLLFIILSFVILEIIGFDILRIPGFGR